MNEYTLTPISKIKTGIPGFDNITHGGLPKDRTTLILSLIHISEPTRPY